MYTIIVIGIKLLTLIESIALLIYTIRYSKLISKNSL